MKRVDSELLGRMRTSREPRNSTLGGARQVRGAWAGNGNGNQPALGAGEVDTPCFHTGIGLGTESS